MSSMKSRYKLFFGWYQIKNTAQRPPKDCAPQNRHNLARAKHVLYIIWSYMERKRGVRPAGAAVRFSDRSGFEGRFSRVILGYFQMVTHKRTRLLLSPLTQSVFFQEHRGKVSRGMISLQGHCRWLGHWVSPGCAGFPIPSFPDHTKWSVSAKGGDSGRW